MDRGEPYVHALDGVLCLGMIIILGFLFTVANNGLVMFCPKPIQVVTLENGDRPAFPLTESFIGQTTRSCKSVRSMP